MVTTLQAWAKWISHQSDRNECKSLLSGMCAMSFTIYGSIHISLTMLGFQWIRNYLCCTYIFRAAVNRKPSLLRHIESNSLENPFFVAPLLSLFMMIYHSQNESNCHSRPDFNTHSLQYRCFYTCMFGSGS